MLETPAARHQWDEGKRRLDRSSGENGARAPPLSCSSRPCWPSSAAASDRPSRWPSSRGPTRGPRTGSGTSSSSPRLRAARRDPATSRSSRTRPSPTTPAGRATTARERRAAAPSADRERDRRAPTRPPAAGSVQVDRAPGVLAVVFFAGLAIGRALEERARHRRDQTIVRTLEPTTVEPRERRSRTTVTADCFQTARPGKEK